jgi:hypothetical protein
MVGFFKRLWNAYLWRRGLARLNREARLELDPLYDVRTRWRESLDRGEKK